MPWSFWVNYLLKLSVVALVLAALYAGARALRRTRFFASRGERSINVIDSVALSPHATVYLLRIGTRYFLIGSADAAVATLAELAPAELPLEPGSRSMG